jgi:Ser/Thr protein kinase RdoA (MazF antagonist)
MKEMDDLSELLREHYGVEHPAPRPLANSWDGQVYFQPRSESASWVVRLINREQAAADARVLATLENAQYPAPRLIPSRTGAPTVERGSQAVIVTTFIAGPTADTSLPVLRGLGQRLGHLHILTIPTSDTLPLASMLPATDMATALDWLRPLGPFASPDLEDTYTRLLDAVLSIETGEDLPHALIHNDAHPGNAIVTEDGAPVFIDWSGAGLGTPMVDLGFLLVSSEIAISWATPIAPLAGRVEAIVDGYARYRMPTQAELDWLPHAIRFRGLLYGAAHLAETVAGGKAGITETWWWERYEAAEALADRARRRFDRHSQ